MTYSSPCSFRMTNGAVGKAVATGSCPSAGVHGRVQPLPIRHAPGLFTRRTMPWSTSHTVPSLRDTQSGDVGQPGPSEYASTSAFVKPTTSLIGLAVFDRSTRFQLVVQVRASRDGLCLEGREGGAAIFALHHVRQVIVFDIDDADAEHVCIAEGLSRQAGTPLGVGVVGGGASSARSQGEGEPPDMLAARVRLLQRPGHDLTIPLEGG